MKVFICFFLLSTVVHARPHSSINCLPTDGKGLSANFVYDGFDDRYSFVKVFKNSKMLFSMNGDTNLNPCLEVDMSAGLDMETNMRDIIAVFSVHEMANCEGPFHSARLGVIGKNSKNMTGNLSVRYNGRLMEEKVNCLITDHN